VLSNNKLVNLSFYNEYVGIIDEVRYWVRLVRVLLLDKNLDIFHKCALTAMTLSRNTSMTDIVHVACASAYSHFGTKEGLRQAQKNIFTYPNNVESWANLIAALLSRLELLSIIAIEIIY